MIAAVALAAVLFGAVAGDRVTDLHGRWTCRTDYGYPARLTVVADGDALAVTDATDFPSTTLAHHDRYRRSGAGWSIESDDDVGFAGTGPDWRGERWKLDGVLRSRSTGTSAPAHLLFESLPGGLLRITRWSEAPAPTRYVELCRPGGEQPDPSACVVPDLPAIVLTAGEPDVPWSGPRSGTVQVAVALGADSTIVSTRIVSSPSVLLSAAALAVARRSTYHTALRGCRPVPSSYIFAVDFNPR